MSTNDPTVASPAVPLTDNNATVASLSVEPGPPPREVPDAIPGYEILSELGRGGMGVVYKAKQISLNRIVALKMILNSRAGRHGGIELERFRAEAEVVSQVQHANIVQVYEVAEVAGQPYFTLEFCANGSLVNRLDGKPITNHDAVALLEPVALAMHAIHQRGVIHRDLKPHNILMASDGTPKVTDFGIAKSDHDGSQTQTGAILGTPSYMAPEQAEGRTKDVGPEADVYSLGAILYECLTGRPPFLAASPLETMRQVLEQDPLPPRMLNRTVDIDLERIVLKCLQKDPRERYATAEAFAEDLRRFRDGEPVLARSVNLLDRLQRELSRSQHESKLRPWGVGVLWLSAIVMASHLSTSVLLEATAPEWVSFWGPRAAMFIALFVWLRYFRREHGVLASNPIERLLWAVWFGYLLSFIALTLSLEQLGHTHLEIYGPALALSGLGWFVMGGYIWGGCYIFGLLLMVLSPLLVRMGVSNWTPTLFGLAWSLTLFAVGVRYWRLARLEKPT